MFERIIERICRSSLRRPYLWLAVFALLSLPAVVEVTGHLRLNTDLTRLLPEDSPAVRWSTELLASVGDGGVFTILFEGEDHAKLVEALEATAKEVGALPEVGTVTYRYPIDFIRRYGYLLVPSESLKKLFDVLVEWKANASPLGMKLEGIDGPARPRGEKGSDDVRAALQLFSSPPAVHQSADGHVVGMVITAKQNMTSLGKTRDLMLKLDAIAQNAGKQRGLWSGIGGTLRNKVDVYNLVMSDLTWTGAVAGIGIVLVLALNFGSLLVVPVLMVPLGMGLLWSFGLIPTLVGELNTITSFLLMILLGMGVEFSIHLVKRFQGELGHLDEAHALLETFRSTGRSILTSGLTTSSGMIVLAFSSFRGFSEFGLISGCSMLLIVFSVFFVLPATIVAGHRLGLVRAHQSSTGGWSLLPSTGLTAVLAVLVLAAGFLALRSLRFDYDFSELQSQGSEGTVVREKQRKVYPGSMTPGALYVAQDLASLDAAIEVIREAQDDEPASPTIGRVASLREFWPGPAEAADRRKLLGELQNRLQGRWIRHVKDLEERGWIESARDFVPPPADPEQAELPADYVRSVQARDGSGGLVLGLYPSVERKNGRNAIAFTEDLYRLKMPPGIRGPTGEVPIFAEILLLVTHEGPWLVGFTFLIIGLLVLWDTRGSVGQTLWILLPLVAGIVATLGGMVALGWKLNFFNMIVLPNLIGMSVDSGVHYYRRWRELDHDTQAVQHELFSPMAGSMLTTIVGYAGLTLAHHQGLRSIGHVAVLGVLCCWVTAVFLLPGLLRLRQQRIRPTTLLAPPLSEPQPSA